MIIPPSPTNPRSPLRRVLRVAGLALAPVLLVAVVGIGLAGPRPEPSPTPRPTDTLARAEVTAQPVPEPSGPAATVPPIDGRAASARPAFPEAFEGLEALTPEKALARRTAGGAGGAVVVTGWMKVDRPSGTCTGGGLGQLGPWCARTGVLAQHAWAVTGADFDPLPAHLHVTVPVGVRLPDPLVHMATADAGPPLPVMVVGRFTGTRCPLGDAACEEPFVVDRIAWADGVRAGLTPLTDDRLTTERRRANPFAAPAVVARTPLLAVLAWPPTIATLDPATATAAGRLERSQPVWYVRVLGGGGRDDASIGGEPGVRWLLLDEPRLEVLATGRTAVSADPASVAATRADMRTVPAIAGGLGVTSLGDLRGVVMAGSTGPKAVSGYLADVRVHGTCADARPAGQVLCRRTGRLLISAGDDAGAGIIVRIPAGVPVPREAVGRATDPVPVVLVARPRLGASGCTAASCRLTLDVDGIPWAAGAEVVQGPVIDPTLGAGVRRTAERLRTDAAGFAADPSHTVLMTALVRRRDLTAVDPAAAEALGRKVSGRRPVWYVRAIEMRYGTQRIPPGDVQPRVGWIVVDATNGSFLASGENVRQ